MTKIAQKKAKTITKLLEKPKISTPVKKISTDGVSRFFHLCPDSFRTGPKINIKRMYARGGLAPLAKAIGHSMPTS